MKWEKQGFKRGDSSRLSSGGIAAGFQAGGWTEFKEDLGVREGGRAGKGEVEREGMGEGE